MSWWLSNPQRLGEERDAINAFVAGRNDVRKLRWTLRDNITFAVDLDVKVGDSWQPLTLKYPPMFPDAAPSVVPTDGRRLSGHQYGNGGELCLEYRPDNWQPEFTGAMMLQSAVTLLSTEAAPDRPPLPSAHETTIGQDVRGGHCRFILTPAVKGRFAEMQIGAVAWGEISEHWLSGVWDKQWMARVKSIGPPESAWVDKSVSGGAITSVVIVRLASLARLPQLSAFVDLSAYLTAAGHADIAQALQNATESIALILCDELSAKAYWTWTKPDAGRQVIEYFTLETDDKARLPSAYAALPTKSVAIVGCGSLGSKIATSLARSGVGKLVLVDDDVVMPGNLLRQEYDVRNIGAHKADVLSARMKRINPEIQLVVKLINLGGQESGEATSAVLDVMGTADLIIDASANPDVFNLCSAVSISRNKPLVWAEVLAGGIGGIIARARPDLDPVPHQARRQYAAWCEAQPTRWPPEGSHDYEALVGGMPMIADDAEASVIASHATRFACDILCYPGRSQFPHSLYVVGLKDEWVFTQPFDVIPIDLQGTEGWGATTQPRPDTIAEAFKVLATLPILPTSEAPDETVPTA